MGASSFHVVFLKRSRNRGVGLGAEPVLTLFIIENFPPPMANRPDSLPLYSPHVRPERSLTLNLPSPGCFGGTPENDPVVLEENTAHVKSVSLKPQPGQPCLWGQIGAGVSGHGPSAPSQREVVCPPAQEDTRTPSPPPPRPVACLLSQLPLTLPRINHPMIAFYCPGV